MRPDRPSGRSPAQIADHNSRAIVEALRRSGALTRGELSARLGLTIPGITNVTRRLLVEGLITETRVKTRGAAVPTTHYALDPEGAFAIGLRERDGIWSGVLLDIAGTLRSKASGETAQQVSAALAGAQAPPARLIGTGIAIDGSAAMPAAMAETSVVAATLAEWVFGASAGLDGLSVVLIEEEIRAGLIFGGRPFSGVHNRAGQLGEMRTGNDRRRLTDVASMLAYRKAAGDSRRLARWIDDAARHLFDAILALTGFLGPARVAIAGDLPADVVDAMIGAMSRFNSAREHEATALNAPAIVPARFGTDSVLVGAALLPFLARLLPSPGTPAGSSLGS